MKMTLYDISAEIDDALMAEEFEPERIDDLLGSMEAKAGAVMAVSGKITGFVDMCKAEEKRISQLRKFAEARDKRLKEYLHGCMDVAGIMELPIGTKTAKIKKTPAKVVVDNELEIPARFIKIVQTQSVDKVAIKAAIKAGDEVPGVHTETGFTLRIK